VVRVKPAGRPLPALCRHCHPSGDHHRRRPQSGWSLALCAALNEQMDERPLVLLFGAMADKAVDEIAEFSGPGWLM